MAKTSMRHECAKKLVELGDDYSELVVLDGDLKDSTQSVQFQQAYPDRFIDCGIAEQNMVGVAAGLALSGKIPIVYSFATFIALRACEQVRTSVAYPRLNVKFIVSHGGISCGSAGTTHHSIEDIGVFRSIPNLTVLVPCDGYEVKQALEETLKVDGPVYIRLSACDVDDIMEKYTDFKIGKSTKLSEGNSATVITTGTMAQECMKVVEILKKEYRLDIRLLQMTSIKPIDVEAVRAAANETGYILTVEEHNIIGGLGSAVSEIVSENGRGKVKRAGINDRFCGVGTADFLMGEEGLKTKNIVADILSLVGYAL